MSARAVLRGGTWSSGDGGINQPGEDSDGSDDTACPGAWVPPGNPDLNGLLFRDHSVGSAGDTRIEPVAPCPPQNGQGE